MFDQLASFFFFFFYSPLLLLTHLRSQHHNSVVLNLALTNSVSSLNKLQQLLVTNRNIFMSLFSTYKFVFLVGFVYSVEINSQSALSPERLGEEKDSVREISAKERVMSLLLSLLVNLQIMNRLNRKRQQARTSC